LVRKENLVTKALVQIIQKHEESRVIEDHKDLKEIRALRVIKENLERKALVETKEIKVTLQIPDSQETRDILVYRVKQTRLEDLKVTKDISVCLDFRVHRGIKENRDTKVICVVTKVLRAKEVIRVHCHF
jgi:hypothetical protein